jgi:deoxyribonuclease V
MHWPTDPSDLTRLQHELAALRPQPWTPPPHATIGGCFVCFERGGSGLGDAGDRGWSAAVTMRRRRVLSQGCAGGEARAPYVPGLLAAREGSLLAAAVAALPRAPDVLLVNGTGRDHPRRAGLAIQLGWVVDLPAVGVTNRTLSASGEPPGPEPGAAAPLLLEGEQVGWWLRTAAGARPVAVTPGWRTQLDTALEVVRAASIAVRTPEPLRQARRLARRARAADRPNASASA